MTEDLNVKVVKVGSDGTLEETLTTELKQEGQMREVVRHVQALRKAAELSVDDRIKWGFKAGDPSLQHAIEKFDSEITKEVLGVDGATQGQTYGYQETVKIDGVELTIYLEKA